MQGHDFFCEVDRDYIGTHFQLTVAGHAAFPVFARVLFVYEWLSRKVPPNKSMKLNFCPSLWPNALTCLSLFPHLVHAAVAAAAESRFNLYGLNQEVPTFSRCLGIILDYVSSDSDSDEVYRDSYVPCCFRVRPRD